MVLARFRLPCLPAWGEAAANAAQDGAKEAKPGREGGFSMRASRRGSITHRPSRSCSTRARPTLRGEEEEALELEGVGRLDASARLLQREGT